MRLPKCVLFQSFMWLRSDPRVRSDTGTNIVLVYYRIPRGGQEGYVSLGIHFCNRSLYPDTLHSSGTPRSKEWRDVKVSSPLGPSDGLASRCLGQHRTRASPHTHSSRLLRLDLPHSPRRVSQVLELALLLVAMTRPQLHLLLAMCRILRDNAALPHRLRPRRRVRRHTQHPPIGMRPTGCS